MQVSCVVVVVVVVVVIVIRSDSNSRRSSNNNNNSSSSSNNNDNSSNVSMCHMLTCMHSHGPIRPLPAARHCLPACLHTQVPADLRYATKIYTPPPINVNSYY